MPLPGQTPRLPKWPFLLGDAFLLGAAWLIADQAAHPLDSTAMFAIAACVAVAAFAGIIPFLADYARRHDEALDERQRSLEALSRTVSAAADQISIVASGFNEIAELAQKNLKQAEHLPHKLQEKLAEFQARLAQARDAENDDLEKEVAALRSSESERLESTADKIARAAAEWSRIETASQKHLNATKALLAQLDDRLGRLSAAETAPRPKKEPVPEIAAPAPEQPPQPAIESLAASATVADVTEQSAVPANVSPTPAEEKPAAPAGESKEEPLAKPVRKRAPRKPKEGPPAEAPAKTEEVAIAEEPQLGLEGIPSAALEFSQTAADEAAPVDSVSADGATRLLVTAYIGIGNRLFVRGEGPGLSWDRGVPLQFVSIGKWRWEALDAATPVKYKLYKNDDIECVSLEDRPLEPGHQHEVTAAF